MEDIKEENLRRIQLNLILKTQFKVSSEQNKKLINKSNINLFYFKYSNVSPLEGCRKDLPFDLSFKIRNISSKSDIWYDMRIMRKQKTSDN